MKKNLKAYEDVAFLKRDVCRPIRLQLELLKPEVAMQEHNIKSTIVLFGSARTLPPAKARDRLRATEQALATDSGSAAKADAVAHSRSGLAMSRHYDLAREFACLVSKSSQTKKDCHFVIVTGGGGGIMEAGNRGSADAKAMSIGLNISLPFEQKPNPYITPDLLFTFHYFSIRKMHFLLRAKALCAFPGGFGTVDELFETLTLIQTRKIAPMPVVLFCREFWEKLINWQMLVELGMIAAADLNIIHYSETAQEAWDYICEFWRNGGSNPGPCWTDGIHPD